MFGAAKTLVPGLKISSVDDTFAVLMVPLVAVVNIGKYEAFVVVSLVIVTPALIVA
jgi:hypothetical protein